MPELLTNPTVLYILFLSGLWLGVTAIYTAGTGLAELGSLILLGLALYGMTQVPTNWLAVALLIVSMSAFVLIPFFLPKYLRWAEFALIGQGAASIFLFWGTTPNLLLIGLMLAAAFAYNRVLLVPLLQAVQAQPHAGEEVAELLGATGRVVKGLNPPETGTAQINGELWTVRSHTPLNTGDNIEVLDTHGLEVEVRRLKAKRPPALADEV